MDIKGNFTQVNSIFLLILLTRITSKLFRGYKHLKTQFLAYLLVLLVNWPCFHLMVGQDSLTIGLAISKAKLISEKVAAGFSGYCL